CRPSGLRLRDRVRWSGVVREASRRTAARAASHQGRARAARRSRPGGPQVLVEQNARLVANAEEYYRAVFYGGSRSWNLRDRHMTETLDELVAHLEERH